MTRASTANLRSLLAIVAIPLLFSACSDFAGRTLRLDDQARAGPAPNGEFPIHVHELPPVLASQFPTFGFSIPIKNHDQSRAVIQLTGTSCACTELTLGKSDLDPGESTTVKGKYTTAGRHGRQRQYIDLLANGRLFQRHEIWFDIYPEFRLASDGNRIDLPKVDPSSTVHFIAEVECFADSVSALPPVVSPELSLPGWKCIVTSGSTSNVVCGVVKRSFSISIFGSAPPVPGRYYGILKLSGMGEGGQGHCFEVVGDVATHIERYPSELFFSQATERSKVLKLVLRRRDGEMLTVLGCRATAGGLEVRVVDTPRRV